MMRRSAMALARKDMIDMLLRRGRLLDIQMLNFFNGQLERELGAASATSAPAAAAEAPSAAADDRIATVDDRIAAVAAVEKQRLYDDFHAQCDRVRALARDSGDALSWMAEAHGVKEWATPHVAYKHLKATPDAVDPRKITLDGVVAAAGGGDKLPESVQVIAQVPHLPGKPREGGGSGGPVFVAASVPLQQPEGRVESRTVNGLLHLRLRGAAAAVAVDNVATKSSSGEPLELVYRDPFQVAARQHVLTAAAYCGLLEKMEEVAALHLTATARYDGLLVRNRAAQLRLAQIASFRFGIESLSQFVAGDGELDTDDTDYMKRKVMLDSFRATSKKAEEGEKEAAKKQDEGEGAEEASSPVEMAIRANFEEIIKNERNRLYLLPQLEAVVLDIYATNALSDAVDCAWDLVRDQPLHRKLPHPAKPTKTINYPFLNNVFSASKYALVSADGSEELQSLEYLAPLFRRRDGASAGVAAGGGLFGASNPIVDQIQRLVGLTSAGRIHLSAPHINLRVAAATVEDDLHALFTFVEKERARAGASGSAAATLTDVDDPIFILCVSRYVSELFANIAVLYRTTAALTVDEAGKGHREWLLAQSFSASSQARRRKFLTDYRLMQAAAKAIGTKENYATHPVELMNVAPRGKEQRQKSSGKKASATAAAGEKA